MTRSLTGSFVLFVILRKLCAVTVHHDRMPSLPKKKEKKTSSIGGVGLEETQISVQNVLADTKETRNGTPRTYPWRLGFRSNRIHRKVCRWFGPARDSSRATTIVACSMEKRSECKHWMTTTTKHSTVVATRTQRLRVKPVEENRSRSI